MRPERGFALVGAIFLLVVIALAVAAMGRLAVVQTGSSDLELQQARAYQAARAGLEWGLYQLLEDGVDCPSGPVDLSGSGLAEFSVQLGCVKLPCATEVCAQTYTNENGQPINLYRLTATAQNSPAERADYAWRRLELTVERPQP
jgi:MSHA biogenesis protein MshP